MMDIFTCHYNPLLLVRLLGFWSLFWSQSLLAQYNTGSFDHISVEDGLSQSEVRTIYKDRQGFMWFGTVDGLNKYDGYNFKHYKHDPFDTASLSHNEVVTVLEDRQGNLWAGTAHGLNQLNRQTGRFERFIRQTSRLIQKGRGEPVYYRSARRPLGNIVGSHPEWLRTAYSSEKYARKGPVYGPALFQ